MDRFIKCVMWPATRIILPEDNEITQLRKKVIMAVLIIIVPVILVNARNFTVSSKIAAALSVVMFVVEFCAVQYMKKASDGLIEFACYTSVMLIVILDFNATVGDKTRIWALLVIILDVLLVCRIRNRAAIVSLSVLTLYLVIMAVEGAIRFGLFDITVGTYDYDERFEKCTCDKPPCKTSTGFQTMVWLLTLYIDFGVTRSFSKQVLTEKEKIETSVMITATVAEYLAAFNLEDAEECLCGADNLPNSLKCALQSILNNLQLYKPYLPMSCLPDKVKIAQIVDNESESISCMSSAYLASSVTTSVSNLSTSKKVGINLKVPLRRGRIAALLLSFSTPSALLESMSDFELQHKTVLEVALRIIPTVSGMVDFFLGNRIYVSFNASRKCSSFAVAAADAALLCQEALKIEIPFQHGITIAVSRGQVMLGDLGTDMMRRFSIIGDVCSKLTHMERYATSKSIDCMVDHEIAESLQYVFSLSIILELLQFNFSSKTSIIWELLRKSVEDVSEEWMYAIDKASSFLELPNQAGLLYLTNKSLSTDILKELDSCEKGRAVLSRMDNPVTVVQYGLQSENSLVSDTAS